MVHASLVTDDEQHVGKVVVLDNSNAGCRYVMVNSVRDSKRGEWSMMTGKMFFGSELSALPGITASTKVLTAS